MLKKETIIFTGHFDIGETFSSEMQALIAYGKTMEGVPLILVGDIAITQKLVTYIREGFNGLFVLYCKRELNCNSECVLLQLPKTKEGIRNRINIEVFEFMTNYIKERHPKMYQQILDNNYSKTALDWILNNHIVPILINKRIAAYGYSPEEVIVIREKSLRNIVKRRLSEKKSNKRKWTHLSKLNKDESGIYIGKEKIVSELGNPLCRGIMFAFYEELWKLDCENMYYIVEQRHQQSIHKGIELFRTNCEELGLLPQKMIMEFRTN